jgi:Tfp pilus assembly protein PilN
MMAALRDSIGKIVGQAGQFVGPHRYFHISLATRFRWYLLPLRLVLMLSCLGLCAVIVGSLIQTVLGYEEVRRISAELERVRLQDQQLMAEAVQEGIDLSEGAMQQLPAEVALANQLLEKRTFSWTAFLAGLEQALPPRLALTSVRLESGGSLVHLTGSATSLEDLTAFTVGLQDHPKFKDPVLAQHRVGPSGLVEFDVTVRYRREGV